MKKALSLILASLCALITVSCANKDTSRTEYILGTVCSVRIFDRAAPGTYDELFARLAELEDILSANKDGTDLARINAAAGIKPVIARQETVTVLGEALRFSALTDGLLDPSVGPLVKAWNIGMENASVPSAAALSSALALVDYRNVSLNPETMEVYLQKPGMKLDLGAVAKGYAADELVSMLNEKGIRRAIVDLGGNIYAMGEKAPGKPWTIGIKDPKNATGNPIMSVPVVNESVVTSGIYERFFEENGKRYHHILNPKTGFPENNGLISVSIIATRSIDADALSTSAFLLGVKRGMSLVESIDGAEGVFIDENCIVHATAGIREKIKILDEGYRLAD